MTYILFLSTIECLSSNVKSSWDGEDTRLVNCCRNTVRVMTTLYGTLITSQIGSLSSADGRVIILDI